MTTYILTSICAGLLWALVNIMQRNRKLERELQRAVKALDETA